MQGYEVHTLLRTRSQVFAEGNTGSNKRSKFDLKKAIKKVKRHFWSKLDARKLWRNLHAIISY